MKLDILKSGALLWALALFTYSCKVESNKNLVVSMQSYAVPVGFVQDWDNHQVIEFQGKTALATPSDTSILIYGLLSGQILETIPIPDSLRGSASLAMGDQAFALFDQQRVGVVTENSLFMSLWNTLLPDSVVKAVQGPVILWEEYNCLVFQIFDGRLTYKQHEYDMPYLWCWNYRTGDSFALPVRWDPMIGGPRFTMPRVYLTVCAGKLIVSEAYSNRVVTLDKVDSAKEHLWTPKNLAFKSFPRYVGYNIDKEVEHSLYQEVHHPAFGKAFWTSHSTWIESIRLYYPELPDTDAFGRFLAGRDKPVHAILRTNDGDYFEVTLPANRYFVSKRWTMINDTLYYAKWLSKNEKGQHNFVVDALAFSLY